MDDRSKDQRQNNKAIREKQRVSLRSSSMKRLLKWNTKY